MYSIVTAWYVILIIRSLSCSGSAQKHASSAMIPDHYSIQQFLRAISHSFGAHMAATSCWMPVTLRTTMRQQQRPTQDERTWSSTTARNDTQSADTCQVFLIAARTDVALVPCEHSRFCASCAEPVAAMDSGCPIMPFSNPDGSARVQLVVTCNIANYKRQDALRLNTDCILCVFRTVLFEMQYFEMINCYVKHFWLIPVCCFCLITSNHTFFLFFLVLLLFSRSFCSSAFPSPSFSQ